MLPLKLYLQAFGPYLAPQTVDFPALGSLFLITGETGSGKTMLLDAMTQALYGASTGEGRDELKELRSQRAPETVPTVAELTFAQNGETYRFRTELTIRIKRTGTVEEMQTSSALRLAADGSWEPLLQNPKQKEVHELAQRLIGLSAKQFLSVVLLPQGKFERFLVAPPADKELILRTLFGADRFAGLLKALADTANAEVSKTKIARAELDALYARVSQPNADAIQAAAQAADGALEQAQSTQKTARAALESAQNALRQGLDLQKGFTRLSECDARVQALESQRAAMLESEKNCRLAEKAALVAPAIERAALAGEERARREQTLRRANEALQQAQAEAAATAAAREKLAEKSGALPQLQTRLATLENAKPAYDTIEAAESAVRLAKETRKQAETAQAQAAGALSRAQRLDTDTQTQLDALYEAHVRPQAERLVQKGKAELWQKESAARDKALADETTLSAALQAAQRAEGEAAKQADEAGARLDALLEDYYGNAALAIAAKLQTGAPCPVCGSKEHPAPCHGEKNRDATQENIAKAKRAYKQLGDAKAEAGKRTQTAQEQLKQARDALQNAANALSALPPFTAQEVEALFALCREDELAARRHGALLEQSKAQKAEVETRRAQAEHAAQACSAAREALADATAKQNALQGSLLEGIPTAKALTEQLTLCQSQLRALLDAENALQQREANAAQALAAAQTASALASGEVKAAIAEQDARQSQLAQSLALNDFATTEQCQAAMLPPDELAKRQTALQAYHSDCKAALAAREMAAQALENVQPPDLPALQSAVLAAREAEENTQQALQTAQQTVFALHSALEEALRREKELAALERVSAKRKALSDALNGSRGVGLTRYVLDVLLQLVTQRANELLKLVHNGRYALAPSLEGTGSSQKRGLSLMVLDAYAGEKQRGVEGLSGGEKFLASLALSIGLKQVVQSMNGGVKMEAMFIDEGFGSLDGDSITDALSVIQAAGGESSLIGVISHVQVLKEAISSRIDVEKTPSGSFIRCHGSI